MILTRFVFSWPNLSEESKGGQGFPSSATAPANGQGRIGFGAALVAEHGTAAAETAFHASPHHCAAKLRPKL
jgi:hypothetical protein